LRTPGQENLAKTNLVDIDLYSLGKKRTLQQYWDFAGIDPIKQNITVFPTSVYADGTFQRTPWNPPYDKDDPFVNHS
jgi:succinate dehydrogenase/fumarate reductase flavoprotein subunit